jgi:hypothetical protein
MKDDISTPESNILIVVLFCSFLIIVGISALYVYNTPNSNETQNNQLTNPLPVNNDNSNPEGNRKMIIRELDDNDSQGENRMGIIKDGDQSGSSGVQPGVGTRIKSWDGKMMYSTDGGQTWSETPPEE